MQETNNKTIFTANDIDIEDTIDLLALGHHLLSKAWLLIVSFIIGATITGLATVLFVTPQYKATSMIYIYNKTTSITSLTDLQIGSQLAVDFQIVATTREVMDNVIEKLGLDTTYDQLLSSISITNPTGSHILKIEATNPDPILAADISNAIASELRMRIAEVMNTDEPSMVEHAYIPQSPTSPSKTKNAAIGGVGLAALVTVILSIGFIMDDTIKTGDDVRKYLNLNVLAEIPDSKVMKERAS